MNPDDILQAAQEGETVGEFEKEVGRKGVISALGVSVILCVIMALFELFILKKPDTGKPAIVLAISATMNIYDGKKIKDRKTLIKGVVIGIIAVLLIVVYFAECLA